MGRSPPLGAASLPWRSVLLPGHLRRCPQVPKCRTPVCRNAKRVLSPGQSALQSSCSTFTSPILQSIDSTDLQIQPPLATCLIFGVQLIEPLLQETHWGESSGELRSQFGDAAKGLPNAPDFGDSYVDTVLTHQILGGVPMVDFLQWIRQRTVFHRGRSRYVFRYELPSLSLSLSVSSPPV